METLTKRIRRTEKDINKFFQASRKIMLEKNSQRGDCWRNAGLLGQFIEIHSMYYRLKNLIYEMKPPAYPHQYEIWEAQVQNALEDMRNFTILAELNLRERNYAGEKYAEQIIIKDKKRIKS